MVHILGESIVDTARDSHLLTFEHLILNLLILINYILLITISLGLLNLKIMGMEVD